MTDKNGNVMTYSYEKIAGQVEFYLSAIQYGDDRKISFTYGERKDQQVNYIAGAKVNSRKILKQISTYVANDTGKELSVQLCKDSLYSK